MPHRVIEQTSELYDLARMLGTLDLPITVEWRLGRARTLDQNDLQWMWATEVAHQRGDIDPDEVQAEWKLRHGVPILREDSEAFREAYDTYLKGSLSYEGKIALIRNLKLPVTSAMGVRQMTRYLDAVQRECLQQGFRLTDPSEV